MTAAAARERATWKANMQAASRVYEQGRYAEAEQQWVAALKAADGFGPKDPRLLASLNRLAQLYHAQGKYTQAERLYQRALAIAETVLGPDHPDLASNLRNLAAVYEAQGKLAEAAPLRKRALTLREKTSDPKNK